MFDSTLEEPLVGEHREAGRAVPRVGARDRYRVEGLAQDAFARTRLLDFGDDRGLACSDLGAQRADEIPRSARFLRLTPHRRLAARPLCVRDFLGLDGKDLVEDVSHARAAGGISRTDRA